MASIIELVQDNIKDCICLDDIELFFEELDSEINSLKDDVEWAAQDKKEVEQDYADLKRQHKDLQEKHNTWTVLATV